MIKIPVASALSDTYGFFDSSTGGVDLKTFPQKQIKFKFNTGATGRIHITGSASVAGIGYEDPKLGFISLAQTALPSGGPGSILNINYTATPTNSDYQYYAYFRSNGIGHQQHLFQ